jgi:hypothetical protein
MILTKYYSTFVTDVEKYYSVIWEILENSISKIINLPFFEVVAIFNHFIAAGLFKDRTLKFFSELIQEKFSILGNYKLEEDSYEFESSLRLYYITRSFFEELSGSVSEQKTITNSAENLCFLEKLKEITSKILSSNNIDCEKIYQQLKLNEQIENDNFNKEMKKKFENSELDKMINKNL